MLTAEQINNAHSLYTALELRFRQFEKGLTPERKIELDCLLDLLAKDLAIHGLPK
jgi:hypothetical protein